MNWINIYDEKINKINNTKITILDFNIVNFKISMMPRKKTAINRQRLVNIKGRNVVFLFSTKRYRANRDTMPDVKIPIGP